MKPFLGLFALLAGVAASTTLLMGGAASAAGNIEIKVLSDRADLISGGDALVEVVLPAGVQASSVKLGGDGRDVTSSFAVRANGKFEGLVTNLVNGPNVLTAKTADGSGASNL